MIFKEWIKLNEYSSDLSLDEIVSDEAIISDVDWITYRIYLGYI